MAIAVMLATFMEVLDTSIAAVALPYIAGSLSATNDEATWSLPAILLRTPLFSGQHWFSLRFGRKRFLIACIVIFTVASFACGAATNLAFILIARAVQGAGGEDPATSLAIHPAGKFPSAKKGQRHGRVRVGRRGRARARANSRW